MDKERKDKAARAQDAEADGIIEGRNAVIEALRAGGVTQEIVAVGTNALARKWDSSLW